MEDLLQRHIFETDRRFDAIDDDLSSILKQLSDLETLRIKMLFSVKVVSVIVGSVAGFFGSVIGGIFIYIFTKKLGG
jgi:hypothetical protein